MKAVIVTTLLSDVSAGSQYAFELSDVHVFKPEAHFMVGSVTEIFERAIPWMRESKVSK